MPVVPHPSFTEPHQDQRIWRYMDLPRFCALLTNGELWFATAEALAVDDPHEGLLPLANYAHRQWNDVGSVSAKDLELINRKSYRPFDGDIIYKISRERWNRDHNLRCMFIYRRNFFINCWHGVDQESVAMWKIYGAPGAGLSIISSIKKIKEALINVKEDIYLGKVRYIDEDAPAIDASNAFNASLTKRSAFSYENEVRLIYSSGNWSDMPGPTWDGVSGRFTESPLLDAYEKRDQPSGKGFLVNLNALIESICISPFAPPWFDDVIRRLCEQFGIMVSPQRSKLLTPPPR